MLANWIDDRFQNKFTEDHDLIVMGDFNVPKIGDKLFQALTRKGLQVPNSLVNLKTGDQVIEGSNLRKNARYDQIRHLPTLKKRFTNSSRTLDFYGSDAFIKKLSPDQDCAREKFSYQLADHLPAWAKLETDIDGQRFNPIVQNAKTVTFVAASEQGQSPIRSGAKSPLETASVTSTDTPGIISVPPFVN